MRHPLSTTSSGGVSEGSVAVGDVEVFVVEHVAGQAVPEDFEPAIGQGAQGGVVAFLGADFAVVELSGPAACGEAAEGPLVDRGAEVMVMGQAACDDEIALPGPAGDGCRSGVALQSGRFVELVDVFADLAGDPSCEAVTQAGEAQVDLPARERFSRIGVLDGVITPGAGSAKQQLGHAVFPAAAGLVQRQELDRAASRMPAALARTR